MIVYPMGSQIYNQVSIQRSTSKMKLNHTILLGFGLKELKITMNIVKVEVKFGVKGGENYSERHESWSAWLSIKWASKSMIKFQF